MAVAGGLDLHRGQRTSGYIDLGSGGESWRGRISPTDRESLRGWLRQCDWVRDVEFAVEGCTEWRYVAEELQRAKITAHLAETADRWAASGQTRPAKCRARPPLLLRLRGSLSGLGPHSRSCFSSAAWSS